MNRLDRTRRQSVSYSQKVLSTGPIRYWPLDEKAGAVAYDLAQANMLTPQAGVHTAVAYGGVGIGDGRTSLAYDGSTSYTNIYTVEMAGTERLTNGGFETAGGGGADVFGTWGETAGDGAIADETVLVHSGSHAAKLTAGATANTNIYDNLSTVGDIVPGSIYQWPFWTRGDGTNAGFYRLFDVTNAAWITAKTTTGVSGTSYQLVTVTFTAPALCTRVGIYFWCPAVNGGIAYFDDVSVKAVNPFNGAEGTLLIWAKVSGAGVWTDGGLRYTAQLSVDDNLHRVTLRKGTANNTLQWLYAANGTNELVADATVTLTGWFSMAITWSKSAEQMKAYLNGAQNGSTQVALGTWAGALSSSYCLVGAEGTGPTSLWSGSLAHCALWSKALTPAEISYLSIP